MDRIIPERISLELRLNRITQIVETIRPDVVDETDLQTALNALSEVWLDFCDVHRRIIHMCEDEQSFDDAVLRQELFEKRYIGLKTRLRKQLKVVKERNKPSPAQPLNVIEQFVAQQAEFLRLLSASMASASTPSALMHSEAVRLSELNLSQSSLPSKSNPPLRGSTAIVASKLQFCDNCLSQPNDFYECDTSINMNGKSCNLPQPTLLHTSDAASPPAPSTPRIRANVFPPEQSLNLDLDTPSNLPAANTNNLHETASSNVLDRKRQPHACRTDLDSAWQENFICISSAHSSKATNLIAMSYRYMDMDILFYLPDYLSLPLRYFLRIKLREPIDRHLTDGEQRWERPFMEHAVRNESAIQDSLIDNSKQLRPTLIVLAGETKQICCVVWLIKIDRDFLKALCKWSKYEGVSDADWRVSWPCSDEFDWLFYPKQIFQPTMQRMCELKVAWNINSLGELLHDWFSTGQILSRSQSFQVPQHVFDLRTWSRLYLHGCYNSSDVPTEADIYMRAVDDDDVLQDSSPLQRLNVPLAENGLVRVLFRWRRYQQVSI